MISTLWSIRTEVLMLEECLSTVTVASLTRKIKDTFVDESVRFTSKDNANTVKNTRENAFHCGIPFFPWRSSLGVMPYTLGVTISAGTVLCVSHPGLEPAMAALRWHGYISNHASSRRMVFCCRDNPQPRILLCYWNIRKILICDNIYENFSILIRLLSR